MKKIVVAGVVALIAVALLLWALIAGTAFLWKPLRNIMTNTDINRNQRIRGYSIS